MPTISTRKLNNLKKEIAQFLREGMCPGLEQSKQFVQYYWEASQKAEALIRVTLGEEGMRLPIDVEAVARALGIAVEEEDLNAFVKENSINKKIGQIVIDEDFFTDKITTTIYVDENVSISSKRYAVAHEIAHYLIHYDKKDFYEDYCIMPMCPKDVEEILVDIFAIFLLIPLSLFFDEFKNYVSWRMEEKRTPVTTEDWIKYLAERSLLSEYYVAYGYQQLRYAAYWIYQAWYNDEKNETVKMDEDSRKKIKKESRSYFTGEVVELLFQ